MIGGLYRPGDSLLHRSPAGAKLALLALGGSLAIFVSHALALLGLLLLAIGLFPLASFSLGTALRQLRPAAIVLALLFLAQLWISGLDAALVVTLRLATLLLVAALVTLTTRVSDMTETLERGLRVLRPLGVDPGRVSLAIALAIRFLPALGAVLEQVREAQRARGLDRSMIALLVPLLVRTLKMADEVAEAIDARS